MPTLTLPSSLTIQNVQQILEQVLSQDISGDIEIEAGEVEQATSPGLQLIATLWHEARQHKHNFSLSNPTEALKEALTSAGLRYVLD